jgi:hypothetical protein
MSEELEEIKEQYEKQLLRIRALRERKETEPGEKKINFYLTRLLLTDLNRCFLWHRGEPS